MHKRKIWDTNQPQIAHHNLKMIRRILNLVILIFIITTLYSLRGDIASIFGQIKGSFDGVPNEELIKDLDDENKIDNIKTEVETPGALRVISSVFSTTPDKSELTHTGVIYWTNKNRANMGIEPLRENSALDAAAKKKLDDMFLNQYFEHVSPGGVGVGDLGKEAGYDFILIGENLALGNFKDDTSVVDAWMESPGHRANILNESYREIGVAVGRGVFEGNNVWMAVQHFGLPKSACPEVDQDLKDVINTNQTKISKMQKDLSRMDSSIKSNKNEDGTKSEKIKEYNDLVVIYNNLLSKIKNDINLFNTQVRVFNNCVEEATS